MNSEKNILPETLFGRIALCIRVALIAPLLPLCAIAFGANHTTLRTAIFSFIAMQLLLVVAFTRRSVNWAISPLHRQVEKLGRATANLARTAITGRRHLLRQMARHN